MLRAPLQKKMKVRALLICVSYDAIPTTPSASSSSESFLRA